MRLKKKLLVAMLLGAAVGASVFAFSGCTDPNESEPPRDTDITEPDVPLDPGGCKHAGVTHVPAVGAQCEEGGNKEYWFCDDCDKYFADEELTVETSLAAVTLGALGHSYGTWVEEVPAQGCTDGVSGHYYCAACETYFNEDKEEFNGLPFPMGTGSLVIKAPHNIKHVSAKEETCTEDGNDEYYQCKDCHKYFVNEFAAMEAEAPMTYPATGHDYPADFTYNYATKQYEKVCANDHSHVITQAAGTEAYPYLISSEAEWVSFAAEHDESTVTTEAEDVYYKVTNNLDFTDVTERVDVFNFTGTIDFDGHSVKGVTKDNAEYWYGATTGLFVLVHDATIKNLNYELAYYGSANALAFPVLFAWRGDVLLDNVTVSGNATHASNNGAAFVYFAWANAYNSSYVNPDAANNDYVAVAAAPIKLTFNNCTNYSNITNTGASATSGYAAAFVGQVTGNSAGNTVEFKNCVNEGTITGYHFASMLMANQNCAANVNTLVVENCVNNGKIYAGIANGASLVVGDTTSGTRKEYNEENSGEGKVVNGANGVTANIAIETLAIGEDGNFVINEVEGATVYKMEFVFSVRDDVNLDENGKPLHWGTTNITIDVNADSKVKALEFVDFQDVTGYEKNEFGIYQTADGNNYVITQTNPELMDLRMLAQPTVYLTAYNADGEVVSVSTCYLADALKDNA